jgi:hypothetical protein
MPIAVPVRPCLIVWRRAAEGRGSELEHAFAEGTRPRIQRGSHLAIAIAARAVADDAVALEEVFAVHVAGEVEFRRLGSDGGRGDEKQEGEEAFQHGGLR